MAIRRIRAPLAPPYADGSPCPSQRISCPSRVPAGTGTISCRPPGRLSVRLVPVPASSWLSAKVARISPFCCPSYAIHFTYLAVKYFSETSIACTYSSVKICIMPRRKNHIFIPCRVPIWHLLSCVQETRGDRRSSQPYRRSRSQPRSRAFQPPKSPHQPSDTP